MRVQLIQTGSAALHQLLDAGAHYAPEFDHGLSDHSPMQLHAMHALGASATRLSETAARYAKRLSALQPNSASGLPAVWLKQRGDIDAFGELVRLFSARIATDGRDAVLWDVLPALLPGVGGGAFHGLIRTGHAVAAHHDGALARGLAYWAASWMPLLQVADDMPLPAPSLGLHAWAMRAHDLTTSADTEQPRIALRTKAWATAPQFAALAPSLHADEGTLVDIARWAAALYAQTGNFTVLHMVTSAHALLVLRGWLTDAVAATRWFGVALFAAFRAARLTPEQLAEASAAIASADPATGFPVREWDVLAAEAIASNDDHAAKVVYSTRALFEMFGDTIFHAAATRGVMAQA